MNTNQQHPTPQEAIEDLLDDLYGVVQGEKQYAFTEALAIAKELLQDHSDKGYIAEKIRHISQCAGLKFFDRETGKVTQWRADF